MKQKMDKDFLAHLESIAVESALFAGDVLRDGFHAKLKIKEKTGCHDLVTQFDVKAEREIIRILQKEFPKHAFLGEESGIVGNSEEEITWVIDPIDGTWNFSRKMPLFSISIAATMRGEPFVGVCFNPISNEMFIGKKGGGASLNGKPIHVSKIEKLAPSGVSIAAYGRGAKPIYQEAQIRRLGSTVLDMCYVAKGSLEGFIEKRLELWDIAAALVVLQEAGGEVSDFHGRPVQGQFHKRYDIIASNGKIHKELVQWISIEDE